MKLAAFFLSYSSEFRKTVFVFLLISGYFQLSAQHVNFRSLRYDEDYTAFGKDTSHNWYHHLKYRDLDKLSKAYLSLGGEIRYQYFYYHNPGWGQQPKDRDGFVLSRFLAHADLHFGKRLRLFTQLQGSLASGTASENTAVNQNPLDLHQLFFDYLIFNKDHKSLLIRFGRQELSYGSQRLISVREVPNNRQSFDVIKGMYESENFSADVFYADYVMAKTGIFDDPILDNSSKLGAFYLVFNTVPVVKNIDLYYFGLKKQVSVFQDAAGKELRHSFGSRIWKTKGQWVYDLEAVYQFGKVSKKSVSAWTISSNIFYEFQSVKSKPLLGLKTELISGDRHLNDQRLNTFNPLYPKGAYFGLASLIGPYNLHDLHPYFQINLSPKISWLADHDLFWRMRKSDGVYAVNGKILYPGHTASSRFIGSQLGTELDFRPNPFLYFRAEFTWFNSGGYLKEAGPGKDITMTGVTAQLRF